MRTKLTLLIACVSLPMVPSASAAEVETETPPAYYPITLSLDAGPFSGIGAAVAWRPCDHFGVRGGVHYADFSFSYDMDDGDTVATFDADILYQSAHLTLDYYPSKTSSFRISAGLLLNRNEFNFTTTGTVDIDGTTYTGEELVTDVDWDDVMPYVAIGGDIFRFGKARRWSMGWEVGVAFGEPDTTVSNPTGGIAQGDLDTVQQDFEDVFSELKLWPILKLSLNYRF